VKLLKFQENEKKKLEDAKTRGNSYSRFKLSTNVEPITEEEEEE